MERIILKGNIESVCTALKKLAQKEAEQEQEQEMNAHVNDTFRQILNSFWMGARV